jgi:hypothetical protein
MVTIVIVSNRGTKANCFTAGICHSGINENQAPHFQDPEQHHQKNGQNNGKLDHGLSTLSGFL